VFNDVSDKFNNSIVIIPTKYKDPAKEITGSSTFNCYDSGWGFKINLYHRAGNGLLFNDSIVSVKDAKEDLMNNIDKSVILMEEPRHIKWTPGYHNKAWTNNVVAVGQSAAFIEPWDANLISRLSGEIMDIMSVLRYQMTTDKYNQSYLTRIDRTVVELTCVSRDTPYWKWFKECHPNNLVYENVLGVKYRNDLKKFPWTVQYYRILVSRGYDLSKLEIPIPSKSQQELAIAFMKFNKIRMENAIESSTENYYEWLKKNIFEGKTSEEFLNGCI
jgi:hypothetical protein